MATYYDRIKIALTGIADKVDPEGATKEDAFYDDVPESLERIAANLEPGSGGGSGGGGAFGQPDLLALEASEGAIANNPFVLAYVDPNGIALESEYETPLDGYAHTYKIYSPYEDVLYNWASRSSADATTWFDEVTGFTEISILPAGQTGSARVSLYPLPDTSYRQYESEDGRYRIDYDSRDGWTLSTKDDASYDEVQISGELYPIIRRKVVSSDGWTAPPVFPLRLYKSSGSTMKRLALINSNGEHVDLGQRGMWQLYKTGHRLSAYDEEEGVLYQLVDLVSGEDGSTYINTEYGGVSLKASRDTDLLHVKRNYMVITSPNGQLEELESRSWATGSGVLVVEPRKQSQNGETWKELNYTRKNIEAVLANGMVFLKETNAEEGYYVFKPLQRYDYYDDTLRLYFESDGNMRWEAETESDFPVYHDYSALY